MQGTVIGMNFLIRLTNRRALNQFIGKKKFRRLLSVTTKEFQTGWGIRKDFSYFHLYYSTVACTASYITAMYTQFYFKLCLK